MRITLKGVLASFVFCILLLSLILSIQNRLKLENRLSLHEGGRSKLTTNCLTIVSLPRCNSDSVLKLIRINDSAKKNLKLIIVPFGRKQVVLGETVLGSSLISVLLEVHAKGNVSISVGDPFSRVQDRKTTPANFSFHDLMIQKCCSQFTDRSFVELPEDGIVARIAFGTEENLQLLPTQSPGTSSWDLGEAEVHQLLISVSN